MPEEVVLQVENLAKHYPVRDGRLSRIKRKVHAVDGVSFSISRGETVGLVGELGYEKSTIGRFIMQLESPSHGDIYFNSESILVGNDRKTKARRRDMAIVFQDPYSSLNPRLRVFDIVAEPLKTHLSLSKTEIKERVAELLRQVGLGNEHMYRYPHQFSGGQRQRISIARSLALDPVFLVLDKPTSALDVSVQAQVLNLLEDLQVSLNLTCLIISHNLAVVEYLCDKVIVMYLGRIVEIGDTQAVFSNPRHPYTKALLGSIPSPDLDDDGEEIVLVGEVPSAIEVPSGCSFHTRCPFAYGKCSVRRPELLTASDEQLVACHLVEEIER